MAIVFEKKTRVSVKLKIHTHTQNKTKELMPEFQVDISREDIWVSRPLLVRFNLLQRRDWESWLVCLRTALHGMGIRLEGAQDIWIQRVRDKSKFYLCTNYVTLSSSCNLSEVHLLNEDRNTYLYSHSYKYNK